MEKDFELKCAFCGKMACDREDDVSPPTFCPMPESQDVFEETRDKYKNDELVKKVFLESTKLEAEGYCEWTRLEETIEFAKRLGVKKVGIAHCAGLMKEAKTVYQVFEKHGLKAHSVCCKVGRTDKLSLGIKEDEKVNPGNFEASCNPIAQAMLLEKAGCELNVVLGLCVGHDSLFFMHSKVPTTVLVAKDRVLGHNPVAAIYTADTYYRKIKEEK